MSWRFRKSFTVIPGIKLNLSARGLSATVGHSPVSFNVGAGGVYQNLSIPGTGIHRRDRILGPGQPPIPAEEQGASLGPVPVPAPTPFLSGLPSGVTELRSASTHMLASESMKALQDLLSLAYNERGSIGSELTSAKAERDSALNAFQSWDHGFLFKRLMKAKFAQRREHSETCQAKVDELEEQLRLTTIEAQIDVDKQQAEPYYKMCDAFSSVSESAMIWDTLSERQIDRAKERSGATREVTRALVKFDLYRCDLINWDKQVPHAANKNGGDLFIYPGFLLYRASRQAFALIDITEVDLSFEPQKFIESDRVPHDARTVGTSWLKCNKDGSPDRRFRDNRQLPIALYGALVFTSRSGLQEEFQISNVGKAEEFAKSWKAFRASITG